VLLAVCCRRFLRQPNVWLKLAGLPQQPWQTLQLRQTLLWQFVL